MLRWLRCVYRAAFRPEPRPRVRTRMMLYGRRQYDWNGERHNG